MRVLVCGDRNWRTTEPIRRELMTLSGSFEHPSEVVVIHGDCRGADKIAGTIAEELGMTVVAVPADWDQHGKSAGPIRNLKMLGMKPQKILAFNRDLKNSSGTLDMIFQANRAGVPVELYGQ